MTISASDVILEARYLLLDPDAVAWTDEELYLFLTDGFRNACTAKPDLYVRTDELPLTEGVRQELSENALQIFDVTRNLPTGRAITQVSRQLLTDLRPEWPDAEQNAVVKHFMTDNDNVKTFYVYPPNTGGGLVEVVYGAVPDAVVATESIPISDAYQAALVAYVVAMALGKNTKRQDIAKSQYYMALYTQVFPTRTQTQLAVAPRATQPKQD